jgi:hypothetical protein
MTNYAGSNIWIYDEINKQIKMIIIQSKKVRYFFLIITISIIQSCSSSEERHVGEWKGTDNTGKFASLILTKDNHAAFVHDNQVIGGKEFEMNGIKVECKYEIDYTKNPIWLDLVIYEKEKTKENGRLKGIARFITDTKIEYRLNFIGERFDKFDIEDKQNIIVFDKVSN